MQNSKTESMVAQVGAGKKPTEGVPDKNKNWRDTLHEVIAEDAEEDWVSFSPAK